MHSYQEWLDKMRGGGQSWIIASAEGFTPQSGTSYGCSRQHFTRNISLANLFESKEKVLYEKFYYILTITKVIKVITDLVCLL